MGAWGEGMQANDTALDAIGSAGLSVGEPKKRARTLKLLRQGKLGVAKLFKSHRGWIKSDPWAVLGLAEHLLDEKFDLTPVLPLVRKALREELCEDCLTWVEPEMRRAALLRFRDRLNGKKVPKRLIERDNEGLFSRMARLWS